MGKETSERGVEREKEGCYTSSHGARGKPRQDKFSSKSIGSLPGRRVPGRLTSWYLLCRDRRGSRVNPWKPARQENNSSDSEVDRQTHRLQSKRHLRCSLFTYQQQHRAVLSSSPHLTCTQPHRGRKEREIPRHTFISLFLIFVAVLYDSHRTCLRERESSCCVQAQ